MWHCIVGCSSSSLCGKRCRRAVWNFLSILNGSVWVSSCCLLSDSLQNSYVCRWGCQTNDRPQMGVLFLDQFGFCSSWELNRHGHSRVWSRNSTLRNLQAQGQEMQHVYRAQCLVEQTSAHPPLIINSFAEKLARRKLIFFVCLCAPAGQSVVVTPESGSQGGNHCSGRQTLRSGRTCHTLSVQRLFGGKAQSLSLHHYCSSQCVFGKTSDWQTPPPFLQNADSPSGSPKQCHYMKDINLDFWYCLWC